MAADTVDPFAVPTRDRPPRRGQWLLVGLGILALPPALLASYLRVVPPSSQLGAMAASFVAYGLAGYAVSLLSWSIALLRARRRVALTVLTAIVATLTAVNVAWQLPLFVADDRPARTDPVTVMTLNLHNGEADADSVWSYAQSADLVFLQEFSNNPEVADRDDWNARFPYSVGYRGADPGSAAAESTNTVIFSRYPLRNASQLPATGFHQWITVAALPGIGDVSLLAVHPCSPLCGPGVWFREHGVVRAVASQHRDGPLLIAGDFNAVDDHLPMRELKADGLVSATDIVGGGWIPTFPANRSYPPLIPIDHVLLSPELTATSIRPIQVVNTDHRGLLVTVAGT